MSACQNDPIRIVTLLQGSYYVFFLPALARSKEMVEHKYNISRTVKASIGGQKKKHNCNESKRICQVNLKLADGDYGTKSCVNVFHLGYVSVLHLLCIQSFL